MGDTFDPKQDQTQGDAEKVKADQTVEHDAVENKADEILNADGPEDKVEDTPIP